MNNRKQFPIRDLQKYKIAIVNGLKVLNILPEVSNYSLCIYKIKEFRKTNQNKIIGYVVVKETFNQSEIFDGMKIR